MNEEERLRLLRDQNPIRQAMKAQEQLKQYRPTPWWERLIHVTALIILSPPLIVLYVVGCL